MILSLQKETLLPMREKHESTEIEYSDWLEVSPDQWIPQKIEVKHGDMVFHMRFQWLENAFWILDNSEYELGGKLTSTVRVRDIVLNDKKMQERATKEAAEKAARIASVTDMLSHNRIWLEPRLEGIRSIQFTHRTIREDVDEICFIDDRGLVVMELSRDGKGKLADSVGQRKIIISEDGYYTSRRGENFATLHTPEKKSGREGAGARLKRYALTGVQFDLPLFGYAGQLEYARIEPKDDVIRDGRPCRVVEVTGANRHPLGCGTMFGFTSWSYVHDIIPASEVFTIDKERNIPLHETLTAGDGKAFEIEFSDWTEVTSGQWAPLAISITCRDYFTCEYKFQLAGEKHWKLKEAVSWFQPEDKSRGEILDVRVNQPSPLRDEAMAQIEHTNDLFDAESGDEGNVAVAVYPFRIGKKILVMADSGHTESRTIVRDILFTMNEEGDLVAQCLFVSNKFWTGFPITINAALFDEKGAVLGADSLTTSVVVERDLFVREFTLNFGRNDSLVNAAMFSIHLVKSHDTSWMWGSSWMTDYGGSLGKSRHANAEWMVWNLSDALTSDDPSLRSTALDRLFYFSDVYQQHDEMKPDRWIRDVGKNHRKISEDDLFPKDGRRELIEPLLWMRGHASDEYERTLIALSLGRFQDDAARTALLDSYDDTTGTERVADATSLGIMKDDRGWTEIAAALNHPDEDIRVNAVWALERLGGKRSVDALSEALFFNKPTRTPAPGGGQYVNNSYGATRWCVIKALTVIGDTSCLDALKKLKEQSEDYYLSGVRFLDDIIQRFEDME